VLAEDFKPFCAVLRRQNFMLPFLHGETDQSSESGLVLHDEYGCRSGALSLDWSGQSALACCGLR
jgi:hypothetical protein